MARTLEFLIGGPVNTAVFVEEGDFDGDGLTDLRFTLTVDESNGYTADIRGLFWDDDNDNVAGWTVLDSEESPDVTDYQFNANNVRNLGNGANMNGSITNKGRAFDAGVEIGTQGIGKDDIQNTSFVIQSPGEDLTLDDIGGQRFGVRLTSVGEIDGPREGSLKLSEIAPHAPDAQDDEARTIAESPTGFDVDIDVLANDTDEDGDTLTVTSVGPASNGGSFSINPDGTINFNPGSDFDDLDSGEFLSTTATYAVDDGNGGTDHAEVTVKVEGFDPGEQTNTDSEGDITLSFTTAERTIDGTTPASATIALPEIDSDIAFTIDVSGSTQASFGGTAVGDVNGDGQSNTILDAEIASYLNLLNAITADPAGDVTVNLISFASGASDLGTFTVTDGAQKAALETALTGLNYGGLTNFEAPLQSALSFFDGVNNEVAYFLSDGVRTTGGGFADEASALDALGVQISAVGVGTSSSLAQLNQIDNTGGAEQVTTTDALDDALLGSPFDVFDFYLEVNGSVVSGIDETDLVEGPLGFFLPEEVLSGLNVGENDVNSVVAYAELSTDGDPSNAEVFLEVENFVAGVVYDELAFM